jgi:hypothetical protein
MKGFWKRLRGFAPVAALLWAGFWGLVTWNVITDNTGAGAVIGAVLSAVAALLPAAMLYFQRRSRRVSEPVPPLKVPKSLRPSYRRLLSAYDQARTHVAAGLIDADVLRGIDGRVAELLDLVSADVSNQVLGGQPSVQLLSQLEQLTALLVGLTDAAIDRRTAALDSDNRAAAALREALGRMRAEEQGYRELGELDEKQ